MSSIEDRQRPGRLTDDVERLPEPDDKPDPHAQWDEVHGRWTMWDEDQDSWVPILTEDDAESDESACDQAASDGLE